MNRLQRSDIPSKTITAYHMADASVLSDALKPTHGYDKGTGGGDYTQTGTTFASMVTILTYTSGDAAERLVVDATYLYRVDSNAGHIRIDATGTGVTVLYHAVTRTASTAITTGTTSAIIDLEAKSTAVIGLYGEIITSGTLTISNFDTTNTWGVKYIVYSNATSPGD